MSEPSRGSQISRRSWLLAGLAASLFRARAADSLAVTFDGDNLHIASPDLHFLTGKPLHRLTEGGTVVYFGRLTLFRDCSIRLALYYKRKAEVNVRQLVVGVHA